MSGSKDSLDEEKMSKYKSPAFQFYPKDWLADINVQSLTREEEGVYIRLLAYCWEAEKLPNDSSAIAQLSKSCSIEVAERVMRLFYVTSDGRYLRNKRLDEERKKQAEHRKERSASGLKGANKRWLSHSSAIAQPMAKNGSSSSSSSASSSANNNTYSDSRFDTFWKTYPNRVGKGAALKAFKKALASTDIVTIIKAINQQAQSDQWKRDNGQYIPNPATWLNQRRWEDELKIGSIQPQNRPLTPEQISRMQQGEQI